MGSLRAEITSETMNHVRIVYLDRETSKWWNQRRRQDDTPIFCGWYWIKGQEEAGPFKTRSAALRDAYYRFVLEREAPRAFGAKPRLARKGSGKSGGLGARTAA